MTTVIVSGRPAEGAAMWAISQSSLQRQLTPVTDATRGTGRTVALQLACDGVDDRGRQDPDRHEAL